jgi:hypothetical protein
MGSHLRILSFCCVGHESMELGDRDRGYMDHVWIQRVYIGSELWQDCDMVVLLAYIQPNTIASNINSMCSDLYGIIVILYHGFQA